MENLVTELIEKPKKINPRQSQRLSDIECLDRRLLQHFSSKLLVQNSLTRQLVSFQANKVRASYRWFKYKEAFSASLVEYLLKHHGVVSGKVLDPFAGMGTALFAASDIGMDADGIELLPVGQHIIDTRCSLERAFTPSDIATLKKWAKERPWEKSEDKLPLSILRITQGAYPEDTLNGIERCLFVLQRENLRVQSVLRLALLCVLESISYTRKDGQCLRWDYRSGRGHGAKQFDKGTIFDFNKAICDKILEIVHDMESGKEDQGLFPVEKRQGEINLFKGSCLDVMPKLQNESYEAVVTSPPYCNRYDYTRTYALELALLGVGEKEMVDLRQQMLSCTVENRAKDMLLINPKWTDAIAAADNQELLQDILSYLDEEKAKGNLNNSGIARMVRGYFYEMACVMAECSRVMKPNAVMCMVNDNVRYAGASISVDLILSRMAEDIGFRVENILVLPGAKGNSSQQMGEHGRIAMRKCVYVWRKI
ncbi:MAG: site-specific DNA-methyltransferase [Deltaproteobacteria bacterium]|nr:site-specific DNA-methyltransferase [Deltaproteobacteria bacterium]